MGGRMIKRDGRGRGLTLLEVMVAIATGAVIFAIAMGVLLTTNQTANQAMGHEALLQEAQVAMKEIRSVLEKAVWPEDMAATAVAGANVVFLKNGLALFSSHQPTTTGRICRYEFLNMKGVPGKEDTQTTTAGYQQIVPGGAGKPEFRPFSREFASTVEFRYATQVGADLQPVWLEGLPSGQKPQLIWVDLVMRDLSRRDRRGRVEEVRLTTAISL